MTTSLLARCHAFGLALCDHSHHLLRDIIFPPFTYLLFSVSDVISPKLEELSSDKPSDETVSDVGLDGNLISQLSQDSPRLMKIWVVQM